MGLAGGTPQRPHEPRIRDIELQCTRCMLDRAASSYTRVGSPLGELATFRCSARSLIRESRTSLAISAMPRTSVATSADGAAFSRDISLCEPYRVLDTLIVRSDR